MNDTIGKARERIQFAKDKKPNRLELGSLDLTTSDFESLIPFIKKQLPNLDILELGDNLLEEVPEGIKELSALRNLSLDNNPLFDIQHLKALTELTVLYLDQTGMSDETISPIGKLTKLNLLSLENNKLSSFPKIEHLTNLHYLFLKGNQINGIPSFIENFTRLVVLDIRNNDIPEMHEEIGRLSKLEHFFIVGNPLLTQVQRSLDSLTQLLGINLHHASSDDNERSGCTIPTDHFRPHLTPISLKDFVITDIKKN